MLNKYKVSYEVYNVKERLEESGLPDKYTVDIDSSWYEYEVFLLDSSSEIVAEWDSYTETYNGIQQLTKEQAEKGGLR